MDAILNLGAAWWWLGAGLVVMLLELATGSLFLLWPALAALALAAIAAVWPELSLGAQLALFAAATAALGVLGRGVRHRLHSARTSDHPMLNRRGAALVGRRVSAIDAFRHGAGAVRLDDSQWSARLDATADAERAVAAGESLIVKSVEGSTLIVARE